MRSEDTNAQTRAQRAQLVLHALRSRPEATLAELAKAAHISRPTATGIITDLEQLGLVVHSSTSTGAGRPAALYSFAPRPGFIIASDLRRDDMAVSAVSLAGTLLHTEILPISHASRDERLEDVAQHIKAVADPLVEEHGEVVCGVASATGIIDGDGVVLRSYLVPQWHGLALADELGTRLGFPVRVDNDINLAAYGEFASRVAAGTIKTTETLLMIRLFAGFRTGLILNGEIHQGHHWHAGEVNDSLNANLRAWHDETIDDAGWASRAAATIGAVTAVVDPAVVVLSTSVELDDERGAAVAQRIESMRLPTAPSLQVDAADLGSAAASVGAVAMAIRDAEAKLLNTHTGQPITPDGVAEIVNAYDGWERKAAGLPRRSAVVVSEPLRVGVVGLGMRSEIARIVEDPDNGAVIVAAVDPNPAAVSRSRELLGKEPADFTVVSSVRELIEFGIGAAVVTSPDDTHAEVCDDLLEAGIPVYLEKPIATTLDDCTRILTKAYETRTKLYVGHNMRHMSFVRQMRQLIADGAIGEVKTIWCRHFVGNGGDYYFKDWHAERAHSHGLLLQKAAHDIDVMHWLAGSDAVDVVGMGDLMVYGAIAARSAHPDQLMPDWFSLENWPPEAQRGLNPVIDVEDVSMLMMRMRSGVLATYQQCHFSPDYWRNYTVIGTRGRIENFGDGDGGQIRLWNRRSFYSAEGDEQFPIHGDSEGHDDADALTMAEFLRFVRTGAPTDTSPLGAWHAVATGIQATESLRNGSTPREIPSLPPEIVEYFTHNQQP